MNLLGAIVLVIILISAYRGMRNGLIKTVFSICSMVIALVLTLWLSPYISKLAQSNESVFTYFTHKVEKAIPTENIGSKISDQINFIDNLPLPKTLKTSIVEHNNTDTYVALAVDNFSAYISHSLASIIINAIAFVITYLVIAIILRVLSTILDIISKLPILHQINKLSGLFVGLLQGIIIVWILFVFLTAFASTAMGQKAFAMINESVFLSYIYNNNIILRFITNISKVLFHA